jgi:hypothetical protein
MFPSDLCLVSLVCRGGEEGGVAVDCESLGGQNKHNQDPVWVCTSGAAVPPVMTADGWSTFDPPHPIVTTSSSQWM